MVAVHRRHVPYFVLANSETFPLHHISDPFARWAGSSTKHYAWLSLHAMEVFRQHIERFGVPHKLTTMFDRVRDCPALPHVDKYFDPPQVMPERYKGADTVQAYRDYYIGEKLKFARWLHGDAPFWVPNYRR